MYYVATKHIQQVGLSKMAWWTLALDKRQANIADLVLISKMATSL